MATRVTILETTDSRAWSKQEIEALAAAGIEVEGLQRMPNRIVAKNKPMHGIAFQGVFGHSRFTTRDVDFRDRWA